DSTAVESGLRTLKGALPRPAENVEPATPALIDRTQPIVPVSDRSAGGAEDFSDWFFSPQGKVTRWATSAAVALVMLAGGLRAYDWKVTAEREALWPQVIAAARESRLEA